MKLWICPALLITASYTSVVAAQPQAYQKTIDFDQQQERQVVVDREPGQYLEKLVDGLKAYCRDHAVECDAAMDDQGEAADACRMRLTGPGGEVRELEIRELKRELDARGIPVRPGPPGDHHGE